MLIKAGGSSVKILLVVDQFFSANNGMTISARRFAETLRMHGNQVKIVSTGKVGDTEYLLPEIKIPFFDKLIKSQGMTFAKPQKDILTQAIAWADIVHFLVPFWLSHKGIRIAQKLKVPYTAAFHVQPENITASIKLANCEWLNTFIYKWFRFYIYKHCTHIHCPSNFIANELKKNGYKSQLHVISNGVDLAFQYNRKVKPPHLKGKEVITMVGRLSREKRQDVLIDAVKKSKHEKDIQLCLAGQGPMLEKLKQRAKGLTNPIHIQFYDTSGLIDLLSYTDVYVHAADMEIEAMSCMEAFATGIVPIIANSKKSATPQFALDERSLFEAGNSDDLAKKIDYWIEHESERIQMERLYAQKGKSYSVDGCVRRIEKMFEQAIEEKQHENRKHRR